MPIANLQGGLGAGVGLNGGLSLSVYPAAESYSDLLGWGVIGRVTFLLGQDVSANASIQNGGNDVRLGVTAGVPKIGGAAGYLEIGKTWGLMDSPINLKNISQSALEQLAKSMGISVKQVQALVNTLKDTLPKPPKGKEKKKEGRG